MALPELGIFATTFAGASVEANLDAVAEHGLGVVQYNMCCSGLQCLPRHIASDHARRIADAATARDIRIAAVSGTFNMIHPRIERRAAGLRRLRELGRACAALGTRTLTLCTGTRDPEDMWRAHPDNTTPEAWADLLRVMEGAIAIADEFDLDLGIEPEIANVVDSAVAARQLLLEMGSARLKIVIDPANLFRPGELSRQRTILDQAFDVLGDHIVLAYARDVYELDGAIHHIRAGTGLLNYSHYLSLLDAMRVPVPLIVHGLSESEVPWSLAFLREMSAEAGRCGRSRQR